MSENKTIYANINYGNDIKPMAESKIEKHKREFKPEDTNIEDLINTPNHYHIGGFDIYEIMQAKLTPEEYRGFCKGNMLKYALRADLKGNPVSDSEKAHFNNERLIENYRGIKYVPKHKQETPDKETTAENFEIMELKDTNTHLREIAKELKGALDERENDIENLKARLDKVDNVLSQLDKYTAHPEKINLIKEALKAADFRNITF